MYVCSHYFVVGRFPKPKTGLFVQFSLLAKRMPLQYRRVAVKPRDNRVVDKPIHNNTGRCSTKGLSTRVLCVYCRDRFNESERAKRITHYVWWTRVTAQPDPTTHSLATTANT